MTITGKCDTCRSRKVKCDELRPKCTSCRKRDRTCTYSFGKVSAFVVENPTELTKHGKSRVAPVVVSIDHCDGSVAAGSSSTLPANNLLPESSKFRMTTGRDADDGQGVFMTLAIISKERPNSVKKSSVQQKRKLKLHINNLRDFASSVSPQLSPGCSPLAARYLDVLARRPLEQQPFAILGSWIETIPSRLGSSPLVDLAVEYFVDSYGVFREEAFSKRNVALATKARALKQLQLAVAGNRGRATYDTIIAMKLHFLAEMFMGIMNLFHVIHAAGLAEALRAGPVDGLDEEHYWSFLDNTYIDDVGEAMISGRVTVYDTSYYLEATSASALSPDASPHLRASTAIMHMAIQLPRLVLYVRHAIENPEDISTLAAAVSLAESLWLLDPFEIIQELLHVSAIVISRPPSLEIADIIADSYDFDSVESVIRHSRYWMFRALLCGLTENLYVHFPAHAAQSLLPPLATVWQRDLDAAIDMARCIQYGKDVCPSLAILPLRIHTTFQLSIGTWNRLIRRLEQSQEALAAVTLEVKEKFLFQQLRNARRMEDWVLNECNSIHDDWYVHKVNKRLIIGAIEDMAGGPVPDWLPTNITFKREEGVTVMKLEYALPGKMFEKETGIKATTSWTKVTTTPALFVPESAMADCEEAFFHAKEASKSGQYPDEHVIFD